DYIMDASRLRGLGWQPKHDFASALNLTVDWYVEHRDWWEPIVSGEFQQYYDRQYGRRLATSEAYRP
ncbi:MAG: dTDP-glucose 4,6-dehydratase, partial [Chloroflexi bacterium]|nr:dTDP-glucose 4,6-dehydratase [Chloroflexota bacterium]